MYLAQNVLFSVAVILFLVDQHSLVTVAIYEFLTASLTSWRPCLASEKSIMVLSVS
jgi:hypothetical protein